MASSAGSPSQLAMSDAAGKGGGPGSTVPCVMSAEGRQG